MKYVDEFRTSEVVQPWVKRLHQSARQPWTIMEVCGGQTHAIMKYGLQQMLPASVSLIHGPGCPVCVTAIQDIDHCIQIAQTEGVTLCTYGDMLRVPGSQADLFRAKSCGADVRIVYSPLDALQIAQQEPQRQVVFFAVGFETTAPATALALMQAKLGQVGNFSVLCTHVLVIPAMRTILSSNDNQVQGFLAAGHVCTVTGFVQYQPLVEQYQIPVVVTGFEPLDLIQGITLCVEQLEAGQHQVQNQYSRIVRPEGNSRAMQLIEQVFEARDYPWRGIGTIPLSGYTILSEFMDWDASRRFPRQQGEPQVNHDCRSGAVLQGKIKPHECPHFGTRCTPETPLGATMVSSEGACAAYFHYADRADL